MTIFQITKDKLTPLTETKFGTEGIYERKDLQRLLKARVTHGAGGRPRNRAAP